MTDPIQPLFGCSAPSLFASPALVVTHGALERFPAFMHTGPLSSIDGLSRHYTGALEIANGDAENGLQTSVSGVHPAALLRLGLTVYFSDLKRSLPKSGAWLRSLEASLGLPECASLMAFANSAGSGLPLHHDRYDQLLFQIRGEKQFRYAPNGYVQQPDVQFSPYAVAHHDFGANYRRNFPLSSQEILASSAFETLHLQPGSAFFMPAGTWHTTAEQATDSLSLVVAVRAPSRLDLLLNLLHYYASQAPEWRARGYGGWSSDASVADGASAALGGQLRELAERLSRLPAADAFKAWSAHAHAAGMGEYPAGARFTRFIRLPGSSLRFEEDAELGKLRCFVQSGPTNRPPLQTVLAINAEARGLVQWVLESHAAFTVAGVCASFADFPREDVDELLTGLAQAGLVRPLPAPEWDDALP